jgi:hypothetical protein
MKMVMAVLGASVALTASLAHAQKLKPLNRLRIVDANGKLVTTVGPDWRDGEWAAAHFKFGQYPPFMLRVTPQRFLGTAPGNVVIFELAQCSGEPFVFSPPSWPPQFLRPTFVAPPGRTVYVPDLEDTPHTEYAGSLWNTDTETCIDVPPDRNDYSDAVKAIPLIDLDTVFTPPFSVR